MQGTRQSRTYTSAAGDTLPPNKRRSDDNDDPKQPKQGNNSQGRRGLPKCQSCRDKKQRCVYNSPNEVCQRCRKRGATATECGEKLVPPCQLGRNDRGASLISGPSPNHSTSFNENQPSHIPGIQTTSLSRTPSHEHHILDPRLASLQTPHTPTNSRQELLMVLSSAAHPRGRNGQTYLYMLHDLEQRLSQSHPESLSQLHNHIYNLYEVDLDNPEAQHHVYHPQVGESTQVLQLPPTLTGSSATPTTTPGQGQGPQDSQLLPTPPIHGTNLGAQPDEEETGNVEISETALYGDPLHDFFAYDLRSGP